MKPCIDVTSHAVSHCVSLTSHNASHNARAELPNGIRAVMKTYCLDMDLGAKKCGELNLKVAEQVLPRVPLLYSQADFFNFIFCTLFIV